jgi:polyhydroxybutyrate depolymerase
MSGRIACQLSHRIVAVAIVAASLSDTMAASCHPPEPISVLILQGANDPLVPLAGGALGHKGTGGVILSHAATVEKFAKLDRSPSRRRKNALPIRLGMGPASRQHFIPFAQQEPKFETTS